MSTWLARRLRYAIVAARTPSMWPVYLFTIAGRRAFGRTFEREHLGRKR